MTTILDAFVVRNLAVFSKYKEPKYDGATASKTCGNNVNDSTRWPASDVGTNSSRNGSQSWTPHRLCVGIAMHDHIQFGTRIKLDLATFPARASFCETSLRAIPQYKKSLWILTPCVELRSYFEPSLAAHKKLDTSVHTDFVDELTLHEVLPPRTRHVFLRNLHVRPLKQKRLG